MSHETAALIFALLLQTGAMFYWGGGVRQMLRELDRRITKGGL